ncbi:MULTISPECIES: MraY family glycosyltransferase [Flammeovirga]|uniref:Undecaprenyl/decaprenyl-phosphate alpha-N-acetylglucosaminyl 1-phosphate transferase n=1 Tax=Flammeovirga agarivorans TaxID=2726742 RepID=A0A7X8SI06_9BACT|nr:MULTISPECIES: MraY family glycosyltransferase [Flammeovirga]NLR90492.1 undecaprenyl/decaprenyl-phosphate alpha-N-acetylglucosaminyl 1-phosphate transferase [Flammeovirga agarivorans]
MLRILLAFLTSLTIALIAVPEVRKVISKRNVFDDIGGRKVHTELIPAMGGVGIFLAFILSCCLWMPAQVASELRYMFFGIILIFFMGVRDDMLEMSPKNKLYIQIMASTVVVVLGDIHIDSLYTLVPQIYFPQWLSYAFSIFVIIALTNAFNLIDGINGLSGGIAALISLCLGGWFYLIGEHSLAVLMISMFGGCIGFLYYNWGKASIFMGDTGALLLGFFISVSLILFINVDHQLATSNIYKIQDPISVAIALFIYPFIDTLRIFTIRVFEGRSPFSPDKKHIHHILIRTGLSHAASSAIIIFASILFLTTTLVANLYVNDLLLLCVIITSLYFVPLALKLRVNYFKHHKEGKLLKLREKKRAMEKSQFKVEKIG